LILYVPAGQEKLTCLRLLFLNPHAAQYAVFIYDDQGYEAQADLKDYGNLNTRLEPCRRRVPGPIDETTRAILEEVGGESISLSNERILRFFSPSIPVERVGVGLQCRKELKVVSRS
jgi:hypothetical protein